MVTAAAGSDAAVVLVDITKLDTEPSPNRPAAADAPPQPAGAVAAGAQHRVCRQQARRRGRARPGLCRGEAALLAFAAEAGMAVAGIVPVSALRGDNVTTPLAQPTGTRAPACCNCWKQLPCAEEQAAGSFSLPVQYVARTGEGVGEQPRVLWGRIAQGGVQWATKCRSFPAANGPWSPRCGAPARVAAAQAGQSAGLVLDRQLDVSRGDWLATPGSLQPTRRFAATLAWLDTEAATPGRKYWLRHGNRWVQARLVQIDAPAGHPHPAAPPRPTPWPSTRSAKWCLKRSSRCRWRPMPATASAAP
jgi:sulfate adenylyltransferase subunit 1